MNTEKDLKKLEEMTKEELLEKLKEVYEDLENYLGLVSALEIQRNKAVEKLEKAKDIIQKANYQTFGLVCLLASSEGKNLTKSIDLKEFDDISNAYKKGKLGIGVYRSSNEKDNKTIIELRLVENDKNSSRNS